MSFFVENTAPSGDFKQVPAGLHLARCYRIIDLGTQRTEFDGQEKHQRKIMLGWELHGKDDDGEELVTERGDPLAIFKNYTLSWSEKANLRIDLQNWRNKPFTDTEMRRFDIQSILGAWCMLTITHENRNEKTYANVSSVTSVPATIKKMGLPEPVNDLLWFDIDEPDMEVFNSFPDYLKEVIEKSPEWKMRTGDYDNGFSKVEEDQPSDDIPF